MNADPSLPDMYRRTAAAILGLTTEIVTKKHWARQAVGKPAELGLSYGGGVMAFVTFAQGYGVKLEPLAPAILAQADAERTERATKRYEACLKRKEHSTEVLSRDAWIACEIVKLGWRAANSAIAAYWGELENAAREAVQAPGTVVEAGKARYLVAKGFLWCQLPSGRCLAYGSPKLKDQVWAKRRIDGELVEAEVMDRDLAEALERKGEARIEGPTKAKVTALGVNSVTKKWERFGLYGGLLCENCLSADTEVLTPYGWTRITDIRPTDMLWDGLAWVQHEGVVAKGSKMTIDFAGLRLTPDHRVWTNDGWKRAEDASVHEAYAASPLAGSDGTGFWPPDGRWLRGWRWSEGLVDRNVRVRHDEVVRRFGATERPHPELRMPAVGASERPTSDARAIPAQGLRSVEKHARPLRTDDPSRLSPLRRARDYGMRALAQLREFLGGHGADMEARPDAGAAGQQRGVLAGELRLGYSTGAGAQYSSEHSDRYASGPNVDLRGVRSFGRKRNDAMLSDRSGVADEDAVRAARHDAPRHVEPVFDIVNAGPLHRFTVRGEHGPVIVSNCTQATARDILVNGMLKAEAAGYEIIAHVYDEIITEVPRGFGDVAEFERLICELPDWAAGLPLMAGGFRAKRYKKD